MEMVLVALGWAVKMAVGTVLLVLGSGLIWHLMFDEDRPEVLAQMYGDEEDWLDNSNQNRTI